MEVPLRHAEAIVQPYAQPRSDLIPTALIQATRIAPAYFLDLHGPELLLKARAATVTMLLVIANGVAQPGIGFLEPLFLCLAEVRILQRSHNVVKFRFQLLPFCTEHGDLQFLLTCRLEWAKASGVFTHIL